MSISAIRSGPGVLVSWAATPDATSFHVAAARYPSPTYYELTQQCCPLLPTFYRPCCPVRAGTTSLQVEGLDAGVRYKFRVSAENSGNTSLGESDWLRVAAVPHAPGLPSLERVSSDAGGIYDVTWEPPHDDGGDLVRGYRILADIMSLNRTGVVLVANTSAHRPLDEAMMAAPTRHLRLPLLPSHTYQLRVQGLNSVGAGALSAPASLRATVGPPAEFELPIGVWRRGRVGRGGVARHRVFLPPGTLSARVILQQTAHCGNCASLEERHELMHDGELVLYAQAGAAPPELPTARPSRSHPDVLGEDEWNLYARRGDDRRSATHMGLYHPGAASKVNATARDGEISIFLAYPPSRWVHLLVHGASVDGEGAEYDVRVEEESGVDGAVGSGTDTAGCTGPGCYRHDRLEGIGWRYQVDPDGGSRHVPWVQQRHQHPLSLRGEEPETVSAV